MTETARGAGEELASIFERELGRLQREIEAYEREEDLWRSIGGQKNPPGTLALHLVGNLSHYVGACLGDSGYVRDRAAEFTDRLPRAEIVARIAACRETVVPILGGLTEAELAAPYPGELADYLADRTTRSFLVHLMWHLGWHLGHIYYHRLAIAAG